MTRAWLILAELLLLLLLLLSFILFYLYKAEPQKLPPIKENNISIHSEYKPLNTYDTNITVEELIAMGEAMKEEYTMPIIVEDPMITRSLEDALEHLSVKLGTAVFIRIFKEEALLEVWVKSKEKYAHLKTYRICAYSGTLGPKEKTGDMQAPEGFYTVTKSLLNPNSKFHLSFNLGYPNVYDRVHKRTGSFLMVHGNCVSEGCYAMTDEKIEEIYALVDNALAKGQKSVGVHAYPFKMTVENMALYEGNGWYDFWVNLKEGYDYFEELKQPPKVIVQNNRYEILED